MTDAASNGSALQEALARLGDAMRAADGGTTDPDRRRSAQQLAELVRSEDDQLPTYANRHLPGREVDPTFLSDGRALLIGVAQLLQLPGREAHAIVSSLTATVSGRLPELKQAAPVASPPLDAPTRPPDALTRPPDAPPPRPPPPIVTPPRVPGPAVARPGTATETNDRSPLSSGRALPFSPAPARSDHALPFAPSAGEPAPASMARPEYALPFKQASSARETTLPAHLASIDLAAHATFSAMLIVYPGHQEQVFAKYGLRDAAERELIDRYWLTRIHGDAQLSAQWVHVRDQAILRFRAGR